MHSKAAREALRDYEYLRSSAERQSEQFREDVYQKSPKLRKIDHDIKELCLLMARTAASRDRAKMEAAKEGLANMRKSRKALLAQLGISEEHFLPKYKCDLCKDTGYEQGDIGQLSARIPAMCKCFRQKLIASHYSMSNLDKILGEENFDSFDLRLFSNILDKNEGISPRINMQKVYSVATNFTKDFGKRFENLFLFGQAGCGKTFVCHAIAKDLLDGGHTVLYMTVPRLVKAFEDQRFNRFESGERELLETVDDVDLLILDDLGSEVVTVVTTAALFDIINHRLITRKPVVISSNLDLDEMMDIYTERIVTRIYAGYSVMKFFGDNIRIVKKQKYTRQ